MKTVEVNEEYQTGYSYTLTEEPGKNFSLDFKPQLTPKDMLHLGIFSGNYFNKIPNEFPADWFKDVVFAIDNIPNKELNFYKVNASQPLGVWQAKGWINPEDPKGWFLWYCRYYMGRRIPEEDARQIKRWNNMKRHVVQVQKNCTVNDLSCRPKQRQALLHWAYDSTKL